MSLFQVSGRKHQDAHQESSSKLEGWWNVYREQQIARWNKSTLFNYFYLLNSVCEYVIFCVCMQPLTVMCMLTWMAWTWRWVIRCTGTWWLWALKWTYTLYTGMGTVSNTRYRVIWIFTDTYTVQINAYTNTVIVLFSLQLGGGPHQVDVFELFPATFQVKKQWFQNI